MKKSTDRRCLLALFSTIGASLPYPILPPLFGSGVNNHLNDFLVLPFKLLFGIALTITSVQTLIDTRLILLPGAALTARDGWRLPAHAPGPGGGATSKRAPFGTLVCARGLPDKIVPLLRIDGANRKAR